MPDFSLRAPENSNFPGEVFVVGDPGERARLIAAGYTDVTDTDDNRDTSAVSQPAIDAKPPQQKAAPKTAPGVETRKPDTA